jgi:hypothetical protein
MMAQAYADLVRKVAHQLCTGGFMNIEISRVKVEVAVTVIGSG